MKNNKIIYLELICDAISPCGGSIEIKPIGYFQTLSDIDNKVIKEYNKQVNAILRINENNWFRLNNKTLSFEANLSDKPKVAIITAIYLFKGKKIVVTKEIVQEPNKEKEFVLKDKILDSIHASSDKSILSKDGDNTKIFVLGDFTYQYTQYDSCGNNINNKKEKILNVDITKECVFTIDNNLGFELTDNILSCSKQSIDAKERKCKINVSYKDKTEFVTIIQEKGDEMTYTYDIGFNGNNFNDMSIELIDGVGVVNFHSFKNMVYEGDILNSAICTDFEIVSIDNWFDIQTKRLGDAFSLFILAKTQNESVYEDRIGYVEVVSYAANQKLKCKIIQPHKKILNYSYSVSISGNKDYTIDNINGARITFKSLKTVYYDDGSKNIGEVSYMDKLNVEWVSERPLVLSCTNLVMTDFNGNGYVDLMFNEQIPIFDEEINLHVKAFISDRTNNSVYNESLNEFSIKVKNDLKSKYSDCDLKILIVNNNANNEVIIRNMRLIMETKFGIEVIEKDIPYIWLPNTSKEDVILYETIELLDGMEYRIFDSDGIVSEQNFKYSKDSSDVLIKLNIKKK